MECGVSGDSVGFGSGPWLRFRYEVPEYRKYHAPRDSQYDDRKCPIGIRSNQSLSASFLARFCKQPRTALVAAPSIFNRLGLLSLFSPELTRSGISHLSSRRLVRRPTSHEGEGNVPYELSCSFLFSVHHHDGPCRSCGAGSDAHHLT